MSTDPPAGSADAQEHQPGDSESPPASSTPQLTRLSSQFGQFTYRLSKTKTVTFKGVRVYYRLFLSGTPIYSVKLKSDRLGPQTPISHGFDIHLSQTSFEGFLISDEAHKNFSLRLSSPYGKELMTIATDNTDATRPCAITVRFFAQRDILPPIMKNRQPIRTPDGQFTLDFDGKYAIPSVKNCVIVNECNRPYIIFRRISKTDYEIDAFTRIYPLCLVGFALAVIYSPK